MKQNPESASTLKTLTLFLSFWSSKVFVQELELWLDFFLWQLILLLFFFCQRERGLFNELPVYLSPIFNSH